MRWLFIRSYKSYNRAFTHQLSFSVSAAIFTSLGFLIIQFVALFVLCGKLFRKELHQLVYGEMAKKQRTGNPYVSFVSFAIGTVILLVAYWIVVEHFMAAGCLLPFYLELSEQFYLFEDLQEF